VAGIAEKRGVRQRRAIRGGILRGSAVRGGEVHGRQVVALILVDDEEVAGRRTAAAFRRHSQRWDFELAAANCRVDGVEEDRCVAIRVLAEYAATRSVDAITVGKPAAVSG